MQTTSDVSLGEKQERLVLLQARLSLLADVRTKLRKLNVYLGSIAVSDKQRQLKVLRSATKYLETFKEVPNGVKPLLATIGNELVSLREGVVADAVEPRDLILLSGAKAVTAVEGLQEQIKANVARLESQLHIEGAIDPNEALILKNQKFKASMPALGEKDFVVSRVPVAFTFQQKNGHSSIGYVDTSSIASLGFKVDNLGGYTVLYNQLVVGVNSTSVYDTVKDSDGNVVKTRQRVAEDAITFKKGAPTKVVRRRDKDYLDVALHVKAQLEKKTNQPYVFVSETPQGYEGGHWFWLMPTRDLNRLARAFPGGHAKINRWGFAF